MSKRFRTTAAVFVTGVVMLAGALAGPRSEDGEAKPAKEAPGKDVFGLTKVWAVHLEIPAKEYEAMQPAGGGGFFGRPGGPGAPGRPAPRPVERLNEGRDTDRSVFGVEFSWVRGTFTAGDETFKNIGFRYKGNSTYMASSRGLKRSIKVELDHFDELHFHGLKTLNLHCGVLDPSKEREALAYAVFRAAGVPAPRTAFAEVKLTVPGKYDKELLGLYTLVEQVDKRFLQDRFNTKKGLLMKPERIRGLDYLGEDWKNYESRYRPKGKKKVSKEDARRVIAFVRLINQGSDEEFRKEIDSYLDVDAFLRFMAANALVANLDSFFTLGHNYYLYLHPETNKFLFIPWDVDLSLGNFAFMGSAEQQMDLSLTHPYPGDNRLADRLLGIKEVSEKYRKVLKELAGTTFTKERLLKDLGAIEKTMKPILARETKAAAARREGGGGPGFGPPGGGIFGRPPDLRTFVEKRTASVAAQLAGASKGHVPTMRFGPGGPGGRPGGPGGRPGGFGMGNFLARPLTESLDADKDGKVTKDELAAGAAKFFEDSDKDKNGSLDDTEVRAGINLLFPPRPGFGRPPARPAAPPTDAGKEEKKP